MYLKCWLFSHFWGLDVLIELALELRLFNVNLSFYVHWQCFLEGGVLYGSCLPTLQKYHPGGTAYVYWVSVFVSDVKDRWSNVTSVWCWSNILSDEYHDVNYRRLNARLW